MDALDREIIEILHRYAERRRRHENRLAWLNHELDSLDDLIRQIAVRPPQLDKIPVSKTNAVNDLQPLVDSYNREKKLYRKALRDEIVTEQQFLNETNCIWAAYLDLPLEEKEVLQELYVKGMSIKEYAGKFQKGTSWIYFQRRKGLDDIRKALGWTRAETENA